MPSALMPAPAITTPATSPPQSTRTLLLGIWGHLSRRRIQLGLLLVVMLASGGAELVSLGAVLAALIRLANLWLNGRLADQRSVAVGSDLSCEAYRRTPTDQEADGRGFPLSRPGHQPGGGVVPLIPCSA